MPAPAPASRGVSIDAEALQRLCTSHREEHRGITVASSTLVHFEAFGSRGAGYGVLAVRVARPDGRVLSRIVTGSRDSRGHWHPGFRMNAPVARRIIRGLSLALVLLDEATSYERLRALRYLGGRTTLQQLTESLES